MPIVTVHRIRKNPDWTRNERAIEPYLGCIPGEEEDHSGSEDREFTETFSLQYVRISFFDKILMRISIKEVDKKIENCFPGGRRVFQYHEHFRSVAFTPGRRIESNEAGGPAMGACRFRGVLHSASVPFFPLVSS